MESADMCLFGCGEPVSVNQKYRPGHDRKLRAGQEQEVGDLVSHK